MVDLLPESFLDNLKVSITAKLATTQSLLDKLDTSLWDAKDLEVFDTLVAEKRQSEKDHHKMQASVNRNGRRVTPADLKLAAADWRYDTETAGYIFVGTRDCALDRTTGQKCHHDICKEAKSSEGVTYLEYDTIIHYTQRIENAKSSRMRSALQKQRDLQLLRDKEAGEEWKDKAVKKFKYLGKDACNALLAVAQQLDKTVTLPLIAPQQRPDTVIEQLGCALSTRRLATLTVESRRFHKIAARMIMPQASVDTQVQSWRDYSALFDYFKNVELAHLQAAMMNIQDVVALNSKMTYQLDYHLRGFFDELSLLTARLDRDTRTQSSLTVQEGLIHVLEKMKKDDEHDSENKTIWPKGYLYYALRQCLIIDVAVREKMIKVSDATPVLTGQKFNDALQKARDRASSKSPFPSITREISESSYQRCQQRGLIHHIIDVLASANKKETDKGHQQKLQLHHRLSNIFERNIVNYGFTECTTQNKRLEQALQEYEKCREYQEVAQAIKEAQEATFNALNEARRKEQDVRYDIESDLYRIDLRLRTPTFMVEELPGVKRMDSVSLILRYARAAYSNEKLHIAVKPFLSRGACEFFLAFQTMGISDKTFPDASYIERRSVENLSGNLEIHMMTFTKDGLGLEKFLHDRYSEGWCIAKIMVRLTIILSRLSAYNPLTAKRILRNMARLLDTSAPSLPASWLPCYRAVTQGILTTYGYLMLEATRVFGRADVDQFVLSCIWILVLHALISSSPLNGVKQFMRAWQFVQQVLDLQEDKEWIKHVKEMFEEIIDFSEIRCASPEDCRSEAETLEERVCALTNRIKTMPIVSTRARLDLHGTILATVVDSDEFDIPMAARVLKYIAHRISNSLGPTLAVQDLEQLWYAFLKAETRIGQGPRCLPGKVKPSSLHRVMHNACSVWDFFEMREKFQGFIEGYKLGYRDQEDLDVVLESLVCYAFSYGSTARAIRKVHRLLMPYICAGPLFDAFEQRIEDLDMLYTETTSEDESWSLGAQMYMNRLDHLLAIGTSVQDTRYLSALCMYGRLVFGNDAEISQHVSSLLDDVANGQIISEDDNRFDSMGRFWDDSDTDHIDVIYSDHESDAESNCEDFQPLMLQQAHVLGLNDASNGKTSPESEEQSDRDSCRLSCSSEERQVPPRGRLRPVSKIVEPVLSTITATAHTRKRPIITFKSPDLSSRGRDQMTQIPQSRNVRNRSPTPFPQLPESLKTFVNPDPTILEDATKCEHPSSATMLGETDIPELQIDLSDDELDLSDFSPFETPEEGKVPIFCTTLSPHSTLLDQIQDLYYIAFHMKISWLRQDHPLRAMLESDDQTERERAEGLFDTLHKFELQMRDFQESLGVFEYMDERWTKARFLAARSPTRYSSDSSSSDDDTDEELE